MLTVVIGNNVPFLLSSFADTNFTVPIGYQYFYNLTDMTPITTNGDINLIFLTGFYSTINNSNTTTITGGMYGYNIIIKTITVNIPSENKKVPSFLISLLEKEKNFNPEWFD